VSKILHDFHQQSKEMIPSLEFWHWQSGCSETTKTSEFFNILVEVNSKRRVTTEEIAIAVEWALVSP